MHLLFMEVITLENSGNASLECSVTHNDFNGGNVVPINIQNNALISKTTYRNCCSCK